MWSAQQVNLHGGEHPGLMAPLGAATPTAVSIEGRAEIRNESELWVT